MQTMKRHIRIDRHHIGFLKFILEAYDGVAVLQTLERTKGVVLLHVAPGCQETVDAILHAIKNDVFWEYAPLPDNRSG
jgi:hypothetical protein